MKLYVKAFSEYRNDKENISLKKELKERYKVDVRRKDEFIYLAILGAQRLKEKVDIDVHDELYITSALGNADILQKIYKHVIIQNQFIRPFDFINILGNTTSYHVATLLGIKDKNIFQISDNFTYINSLISIYASLRSSKKEAIFGSLDLVSTPIEIVQRVLGLERNTEPISSVNYQKLSLNSNGAIAWIEFDTKTYTKKEIEELVSLAKMRVVATSRCNIKGIKSQKYSFETIASNVVNTTIQAKQDTLLVECYDEKYKILKIKLKKG